MDNNLKVKAALSLHEVAQGLLAASLSVHDAEVMIAEAIESGALHANVKRWSTEQWEGNKLPGNLNRQETFIDRNDLNAWLVVKGLKLNAI